jgi:farnesyl-diphosphate farnesyltransferase
MHLKIHEPGWNFDGSGPNESDRIVLVEFENIQAEFADLDPKLVQSLDSLEVWLMVDTKP